MNVLEQTNKQKQKKSWKKKINTNAKKKILLNVVPSPRYNDDHLTKNTMARND